MSFASRHKKGSVTFDINIEGFIFKKLETLYKENGANKVYTMNGCYISTKGKFGDSPVAILEADKVCANLPVHMIEEIREILKSDEDVQDIKAGNARFKIEEYKDKNFGKICYGVDWIE